MKRTKAVVLSLAVLFALSGFALARDHDHDNDDRGKDGYRAGYSRGYQAGQQAARNDRGYGRHDQNINDTDGYSHNMGAQGQYKKGYREGYRKGYDETYANNRDGDRDHDRDRDGDRDRGRWGHHNNQPPDNLAHQTGYQDGFNEGQKDKRGGHSYRPHEHDETYGNADHNYSQAGGDKNDYKRRYREGFDQGYKEGYYKR